MYKYTFKKGLHIIHTFHSLYRSDRAILEGLEGYVIDEILLYTLFKNGYVMINKIYI